MVGSYESLVLALEARFQDRRPAVADLQKLVIKGYPTADESTSETLVLHHFLKGLPDRQAAVSVGMTNPTTVEEARTALETYGSLRDKDPKPPKARVIGTAEASSSEYITKAGLHQFGEELKSSMTSSMDSKVEEIKSMLKPRGKKDLTRIECYKCHKYGHFARDCKGNKEKSSVTAAQQAGNA